MSYLRWVPPELALPNPVADWLETPLGRAYVTRLYSGLGDTPYSGMKRKPRRPEPPQPIPQADLRTRLAASYTKPMSVRVVPRGVSGIDQEGKPVELTPLQRQRIGTATRLALTGPALATWRAENRKAVKAHTIIAASWG